MLHHFLDHPTFGPVMGHHEPLTLRWSLDQLKPIADRLAPSIPDNPTEKMMLATASVARSLVAEKKRTGKGVHYARAKDAYRAPMRYRDGDELFTWYFVNRAIKVLGESGLAESRPGIWNRHGKGSRSVAWATDDLATLIGPLVDVDEQRGIPALVEIIVLRDRADKTDLDYQDTAQTIAMREQVESFNSQLAQLVLRQCGTRLDIPVGRRIFNGSFDRGGRFYFRGDSIQNMRADDRLRLELVVDETAHPLVEIDYMTLHVALAFADLGIDPPDGDLYIVEGWDRDLVKFAVNVLFNAGTRARGVQAVADALRDDQELGCLANVPFRSRTECRPVAEELVKAVEKRHALISDLFGSDCGARFQRIDSEMAVQVMLTMIQKTGRCPLPIHDSFLVADIDANSLRQAMTQVADERGLVTALKEKRQTLPRLL
jgi:hypothetical protein